MLKTRCHLSSRCWLSVFTYCPFNSDVKICYIYLNRNVSKSVHIWAKRGKQSRSVSAANVGVRRGWSQMIVEGRPDFYREGRHDSEWNSVTMWELVARGLGLRRGLMRRSGLVRVSWGDEEERYAVSNSCRYCLVTDFAVALVFVVECPQIRWTRMTKKWVTRRSSARWRVIRVAVVARVGITEAESLLEMFVLSLRLAVAGEAGWQ